ILDLSKRIKDSLLSEYITINNVPKIFIASAIEEIDQITNKYGIIGYPKIDGDRIYLSPTKYDNNDSGNMYYYSNPVFKVNKPFSDICDKYLYKLKIPYLLTDLRNNPTEYILKEFPLNIQEELLEKSYLAPESILTKYIQNFYKKYTYTINNKIISSLMFTETNTMRCLINNEWQNCSPDEVSDVKNVTGNIEDRARNFGYYGIKTKNKFFIKIIPKDPISDKRLAPRGRICASIDKSDLLEILNKANISEYDENSSKNTLCEILDKWFTDNDLILYI